MTKHPSDRPTATWCAHRQCLAALSNALYRRKNCADARTTPAAIHAMPTRIECLKYSALGLSHIAWRNPPSATMPPPLMRARPLAVSVRSRFLISVRMYSRWRRGSTPLSATSCSGFSLPAISPPCGGPTAVDSCDGLYGHAEAFESHALEELGWLMGFEP